MAQITANGRKKVGTFKKEFKAAYGVGIRIYNGVKFADDDASLASVRTEKKEGEIAINAKMLAGNLEKKFMEQLGVKVQVENKDGELADNSVTLASLCK